MVLEVTPGGIDQIDPQTNRLLCSYDYRSVEGFVEVSDYQGGFCILYGGFSRLVRSAALAAGQRLDDGFVSDQSQVAWSLRALYER